MDRAAAVRAILFDVDGVLTDGTFEPADPATGAPERKRFHSRDGLGLVMARRAGLRLGMMSGRASAIVRQRAAELELDFLRENCWNKGETLEEACRELALAPAQVAFVGDDVLDLPALDRAGFSAAPADAHPEVLRRVDYVARAPGGRGAVRDIVEHVLAARGLLDEALFGFG